MAEAWARQLTHWTDAGLIDQDTADRIRTFERTHADSNRLRWPILIALTFGALTIAAGTLLFVSAHWDTLSPFARFGLVITLVAGFHVGAALTADRFPAMATTLHGIGTAALGAGIFLAGQIFNLDEHWPGGLMLWALGAALAAALLREWPQTALVALLAPAWLLGEWSVAIGRSWSPVGYAVSACGTFLIALTYFTNVRSGSAGLHRRTLQWLGGIFLIPAALTLAAVSGILSYEGPSLPTALSVKGWGVAVAVPLMVAIASRGSAAWPNLLASFWAVVAVSINPVGDTVYVYAWWALGAAALAAWGVKERRAERINMGAVFFGGTVIAFYFSQVMDKLGRSASLLGLGVLLLAGGWAVERVRRRLVVDARGGVA